MRIIAIILALVLAPTATAATVTLDPRGVTVVDGTPLFTVGLSGAPPDEAGMSTVTTAGVRMFRFVPGSAWTPETITQASALMDAAAARGSFVWLGLRELIQAQPGTPEEAMLQQVVQTLAPHQGMGIWRGADEPWWSDIAPEELAHGYSIVKSLDANHPLHTIQAARGTPTDLSPYSAITDMHGADPYPVGIRISNPDLHAVGRWAKTMLNITPSKGVLMTLAICHSGSSDGEGNYLQPTYQQMRYMVYDAIINGARGINFYGGNLARCMNAKDQPAGWNWTFWNTVLGRIVGQLAPHNPFHAALTNPGTGVGLRTNSTMSQVVSRRVGRDLWVVVANRQGTRDIRIFNFPKVGEGKIHGAAPRRIVVFKGGFTDRFAPWQVRIYRFPMV